jgi:hypothetical protein
MPNLERCCRCGSESVIPTTSICRPCLSEHAFAQMKVLWACLLPEQREVWLRSVCVRRSA